MHKTRLNAAVDRYVDQNLMPTALLTALQEDEKGYSEEEINEIFQAILERKLPQTNGTTGQQPAAVATEPINAPAKAALAVGYVVANIWHGSWKITKTMLNPMTGRRVGIAFEFLKAGAAKREGVKIEQRRMEALNLGAHINVEGITIEQIIPIDHEGTWTYEREVVDGIPQ